MSLDQPTDKQAAFLMKHLSPEDRDRMIAEADNVADARHRFAEVDRGRFWLTDGDIPA